MSVQRVTRIGPVGPPPARRRPMSSRVRVAPVAQMRGRQPFGSALSRHGGKSPQLPLLAPAGFGFTSAV